MKLSPEMVQQYMTGLKYFCEANQVKANFVQHQLSLHTVFEWDSDITIKIPERWSPKEIRQIKRLSEFKKGKDIMQFNRLLKLIETKKGELI